MPSLRRRRRSALLPVALFATLALAPAAHAAPASVPCSAVGGGHFNCTFYPSGDGLSGGAPVLNAAGARVGYLNHGTNWVVCQQVGGRQTSGGFYNDVWAWTEANDQSWGWVSAVWAQGGDNDGPFGGGVPNCGNAHGAAPGAAAPHPAPTPTPQPQPTPTTPAPTPTPAPQPAPQPKPGTVLPEPVNMGSYGTYSFRYQLWRGSNKHRKANFDDWTASQMMAQLNSNFSHYFTFTGCGKHLVVGAKCTLNTKLAPDAPVEVIAVAPDGFALKSRGGHPEGAGRTIEFQFQPYVNAVEYSSMSLLVQAWGPLGGSSLLGPLNSKTIAGTSWDIFQSNIKHRFPDKPPGGVAGAPVEV
jgi:hypothetical protein